MTSAAGARFAACSFRQRSPADLARFVLSLCEQLERAWHVAQAVRSSYSARACSTLSAAPAGCRTSAGLIVSDRDPLALDLPPGRHAVQLRYAPSELGWCVLLSAFGFIALAVMGFFRLPL